MTVKELRDELNKLMEDIPNTTNDEIYFYDYNFELHNINEININWDLDGEGRYICLE